MSIEINWETLTGGEDGARLAETIRAFIHDRFQKVTLPKLIRSVKVHSFHFGSIAPDIEIKDVCDPLPDFYEEEDDDDPPAETDSAQQQQQPRRSDDGQKEDPSAPPAAASIAAGRPNRPQRPTLQAVQPPGLRREPSTELPMSPAIPGGTTNLSYFHMPLNPGLAGHGMPLGSVTPRFGNNWPLMSQRGSVVQEHTLPEEPQLEQRAEPPDEPAANDVQIVSHLRYSGDVRLSLTADILFDYPTTSFVGIPLQLNVTGLSFDGVAILAYIKHRAHFCFLAPDDADALVGGEESGLEDSDDDDDDMRGDSPSRITGKAKQEEIKSPKKPVGRLFEEIHVESEIGQHASGKQVLKNVGKVEKFVLEQVRKIFENEFVYPSFWTFLV